MFNKQINHYKEKFHKTLDAIDVNNVLAFAKSNGISGDSLKKELEGNSNNFRLLCYHYAQTLMPGRVSCTTYAAVVAVLAKHFNLGYVAMSGFCLPKDTPTFEKEMLAFDTKKKQGVEHPIMATHVFVKIGDKIYEYYNGDTSNIEHIDCVEI